MNNDILAVLEYMEKEKGISRQEMIQAIISSIRASSEKGVNAGQDLKIEIDPKTGKLSAWAVLEVTDSVSDPQRQIALERALKIAPSVKIGEFVEKPIDPAALGRIAAQTARQAIMQKIRQFEKERIYDDFKDRVGDLVSGVVRRRERNDLYVDLGKAEALLPYRERVPGEEYTPGDRIRCLLLEIAATPRGPELILSRSHPNFIRRLFEVEVSEIHDGTVEIAALSREAGYRTKLAVNSADPRIDPVGACVGARGARVKGIVKELGGEKVDIIRYSSDPVKFLEEAIKPAKPLNVKVHEAARTIYFEVSDDDIPVAIGRKGQNARLTSKLIGWQLEIEKVRAEGFSDKVQAAVEGWNGVEGISPEFSARLVANGFVNPEAMEGVELSDLTEAGFSEEEASSLLQKIQKK
jgi:transcription termination/antitermination protein NusA